jgi:hypothetical protein
MYVPQRDRVSVVGVRNLCHSTTSLHVTPSCSLVIHVFQGTTLSTPMSRPCTTCHIRVADYMCHFTFSSPFVICVPITILLNLAHRLEARTGHIPSTSPCRLEMFTFTFPVLPKQLCQRLLLRTLAHFKVCACYV